jgi:hypothetical protein
MTSLVASSPSPPPPASFDEAKDIAEDLAAATITAPSTPAIAASSTASAAAALTPAATAAAAAAASPPAAAKAEATGAPAAGETKGEDTTTTAAPPGFPDMYNLASLAPSEAARVTRLRDRLLAGPQEVAPRDQLSVHTLVRFSRARPGPSLDEAEAMLRAHFAWRRGYGADTVGATWPADAGPEKKVIDRWWYAGDHGTDKRGLPVHYVKMGPADPSGLVRECGLDAFTMQHVSDLERQYVLARQVSEARQTCVCSFIEVVDLKGFEYGRAMKAIKHFKAMGAVLEANYPERVHKVYIVRAPALFKGIWAIAKKFVPKETGLKIKVRRVSGGRLRAGLCACVERGGRGG